MENWVSLMSEVGFPIIITLYLLHRIEKKLEAINDSLIALPHKLRELE